jgi:hypothetical protein
LNIFERIHMDMLGRYCISFALRLHYSVLGRNDVIDLDNEKNNHETINSMAITNGKFRVGKCQLIFLNYTMSNYNY